MNTAEGITAAIGAIAVLVAAYGVYVNRRNHSWQRRRDEEGRGSNIVIDASEKSGLGGGDLVIGETRAREHRLIVYVKNRAERPAYISSVRLEPERPSPLRVVLHNEGTRRVDPGDSEEFILELDGSKAFAWDERFRIVVELANGALFSPPYTELDSPPHHGRPFVVPDLDAVPDDQVHVLRPEDLTPGPPE